MVTQIVKDIQFSFNVICQSDRLCGVCICNFSQPHPFSCAHTQTHLNTQRNTHCFGCVACLTSPVQITNSYYFGVQRIDFAIIVSPD